MMYYFMPKAAERPVYSYKLSILHFWSLIFLYIWAGPHHLHYTALPEWASTLGMVFSLMLWMPSWGGMINGLLTLRGAWQKVVDEPVLKFFVVAVTAYGMSTFEGPMLSIKSVNALAHYTDWVIAHVHTGTLGWNGFMTFGMVYWLLPRLFQTQLYSKKLAEVHFWIASFGILLYVVAIYSAGVTQGLMWRAFDETGRLALSRLHRDGRQAAPDVVDARGRRRPVHRRDAAVRLEHPDDVAPASRGVRGAGDPGGAAGSHARSDGRGARRCPGGVLARVADHGLAPHVGRTLAVLQRVGARGDRGRVAVRDHPDVPDQVEHPDDRVGASRTRRSSSWGATCTSARDASTATRR